MEGQKTTSPEAYKKYIGYKFFKLNDDNTAEIIRVIRVYDDKTFKILLEDGTTKNIGVSVLKDYTPLEPTCLATFNIVLTGETFDVVVGVYKLLDVKIGNNNPYIIARQGVRDIFYDICCKGDPLVENNLVGISVSRDTCPANMNINEFTACDFVVDSKIVHFYKEDNISDILQCVPLGEFEKIMNLNFEKHMKSLPNFNPFMLERKEDHGWCKDLETFLDINNVMEDINLMQGITGVDFTIADQLVKEGDFNKLNDLALIFFNYTFKVNAVEARVIEYDNSVNLSDFNNSNYTMIRDNKNKLYIIVYLVSGTYLESDLEKKMKELSVSDKLRLSYRNKYGKYAKEEDKDLNVLSNTKFDNDSGVKVSQI